MKKAVLFALVVLLACGCETDTSNDRKENPAVAALLKARGSLSPTSDAIDPSQFVTGSPTERALALGAMKDAPCRFACGAGLTPRGEALKAFVLDDLESHGLDGNAYNVGQLQSVLAKVGEGKATTKADAKIRELLIADSVDREQVYKDLDGLGVWEVAKVDAVATEVNTERKGKGSDAVAKAEALLTQAAIRLVLDYRFFVVAGPDDITEDEEAEIADKRTEVEAAVDAYLAQSTSSPLEGLKPEHPDYDPLVKAHKRYLGIDPSTCPDLPEEWRFKANAMPGKEVKVLQRRLKCELYYSGEPSGTYDDATKKAVSAFQRDHALEESGLALEQTVRSVNVPIATRQRQLMLSIARLREAREPVGEFYLEVNLPAFELTAFEKGHPIERRKVIVGTNKLDDDKVKLIQGHINRTQLFTTDLYEVVINPDWILPERVSKGEVIGHLEKNPKYLEEHGIQRKKVGSGREVLVQGPGKQNPLGKVKFLLRKSNAIYLHDTDNKVLFRKNLRAFSHGCIRVHEATDFALWLLEKDGHQRSDIERSLRAKKVQRGVALNTPVRLRTTYRTVAIGEGGHPIFLADIYKYDKEWTRGKTAKSTDRWGGPRFRPHWVPPVPYGEYKAWKAAGKPAPRNYGKKKKRKK